MWRKLMRVLLVCIAITALSGEEIFAADPEPVRDELPSIKSDDPRITPVVRAYRKVRPCVVNIATEQVVSARMGFGGSDLFDHIFPSPFVRRMPVQSLGSGFVIHPSGYIVTNAHVVRRAQKIEVILQDKTRLNAEVISSNQEHDLAILKVDAPRPMDYLTLGRSDDLMEGETVIAVGNPLGFSHTVSQGIISALGRELDFGNGVRISALIQTDASINPGNSGGPLLNIKGELIGITTAIRADAQNIGFAIPVDTLADELASLLDFERINRVIFGAKVAIRREDASPMVVVNDVTNGTPAAEVLQKDDVILSLDGKPVKHLPDWVCPMVEKKPDEPIRIGVLRQGQRVDVEVSLVARPAPDGARLARTRLGITLREITPELARKWRLPVESGLVIVEVERNSPADEIGVRPGDILIQLEQLHVATLDSLGQLLEDMPGSRVLRIGIIRGNIRAFVSIRARGEGLTDPSRSPVTSGAV